MAQADTYEFKAEIKKLLDILSKSLYQHKEIFLRELISNSVDALKKLHFLKLQSKEMKDPDLDLFIELKFDRDAKTITVSDTGIGMTKEELISNLGTIAGSGSEKFLESIKQIQDSNKSIDLDIIGQFGVGFYSVFMVADHVEVITSSYIPNEPAYKWRSAGTGEFTIEKAERPNRGTDVILYIKDDEKEFLDQYRLEEIVKKYSNFMPYPIYISEVEQIKETQEADVSEKKEEDKEKTEKKEEKEKKERKPVNEITPLWKKASSEIKDEDYESFYHYIAKRYDKYMDVINYGVDGKVQFKSLLYIPGAQTRDLFDPELEYGPSLYSKSVLIMQNCKDLIPVWLRFIKGAVDSDDIPLNVSRETIQGNRTIMKMKDLIVKRILKQISQIMETDSEKYKKFWNEFGIFIKEGIVSDIAYRDELLKFLRFYTSKSAKKLIGLEDYIKNMPPEQKDIYYLIGENLQTLKLSPHLGYYNEKGYEVILFTEPIDNFLMMNLHVYKTKIGEGEKAEERTYYFKSIDVTEEKEKTSADKKEEPTEEKEKKESEEKKKTEEEKEIEISEGAKRFLQFAKEILGDKVIDVKVSNKVYNSPCRLANPSTGLSSSMQRAMRYWTQTKFGKDFEIPRKIFEFNPNHPVFKCLVELYEKEPTNGKIKPIIIQLYENCLLSEGDLPNPSSMVPRINQLIEMLITGRDDVKNPMEELEKETEKETEKDEKNKKSETENAAKEEKSESSDK